MRLVVAICNAVEMNKHNSYSLLKKLKTTHAFLIAFSILATLITNNSHAAKVARVFVDSEASSIYNEHKESENGETYETYVFIKGNFYGGDISDNSLKNVTFEELVGAIGDSMKQRNFYPSASADEGDLLVVVHYGLMSVPQDLGDLFQADMDDPYGEQPFDEDDEEGDEEQIVEDPLINDTYFNDLKRLSELSHNNQAGMSNIKLGIGRALNRRNLANSSSSTVASAAVKFAHNELLPSRSQYIRKPKERRVQHLLIELEEVCKKIFSFLPLWIDIDSLFLAS